MSSLSGVHLPIEVLQQIASSLDPIALIAVSQTCRTWRTLINPLPHDFVRRLLALELLPEHGGLVPRWDEIDSKVTPPFDSEEWNTTKYACCGCMKLQTHMMFDNHALLRRHVRKPPPGSIEHETSAVTDWEPLEPGIRLRRIHERAARITQEGKDLIKNIVGSYVPPAPFARESRAHQEEIARVVDRFLAGNARHKRRCVECLYRRGDWSLARRPVRGAQEIPIAISRQLRIADMWERYFPGLIPKLAPDQSPRFWRVYRDNVKWFLATLAVIRCPSCGLWREQAAFREWTGPHGVLDVSRLEPGKELICNSCHLSLHKDEALLAQELNKILVGLLEDDLESLRYFIGFGWRILNQDFTGTPIQGMGSLNKHRAFGEELLDGLKWVHSKQSIEFGEEDFPDLRHRVHRYRQFIYNEVDATTRGRALQSWFKMWVEDYDLYEAKYHWLKQQIAFVESHPTLALEHTLRKR